MTTPTRSHHDLTTTYSQVLLPVDFSPMSWQALPLANQMSRRFDVPRHILHVDVNSPWLGEGTHKLLLKAAPRGEPVDVDVVAARSAARGIVGALSDEEGSLLVMSTHGHSGLAEIAMGSTAEAVLRQWSGPMLAVGPRFHTPGDPAQRIVLAVEPSTSPPVELIGDVRALALRLPAPVEIIAVTTPAMAGHFEAQHAVIEHLQSLAELISVDDDVDVRVEPIDSAREAHTIAEYADSKPGTIVALTSHARRPTTRIVLGSVAMSVLRHVASPVLVRRFEPSAKE